ncbi:MAG: hypothetical protein ACI9IP_002908 [Arcticibacterium sp.]|jgi:hypothetical protein
MKINELSERLLLAVKKEEKTDDLETELANLKLDELTEALNNDTKKKAFWINCYNAFYQIFRRKNLLDKSEIYTAKAIHIAEQNFSLDDIEHGILRKYRVKISLGYLANIFAPILIKKLAVRKIDYRIHFALNCGAKSCPPIAFYSSQRLEQQLELATISFLEGETIVKLDRMEIHVTSLFSWFRGDFGGTSGIKQILKEKLKTPTKGLKLVYMPYSWEDDLGNFSS